MITPLDILSIETWTLLISVIVLFRLYIYKKWQFFKNLNIPHDPPTILGFGNMKTMLVAPEAIFKEDLIQKKKHGHIFGSYLGLSPRITISDPEILKHIYIKEFSNFKDRQKQFTKVNGKEFNASLNNASGETWKRIRNTLSPTFSSAKLKEMIGIIEECSDLMVESLQKIYDNENGRFSPKELFGKFSMDVLCSAAFSVNINSQIGEPSKEVEMANKIINRKYFQNPLIFIFLIFPWTENIAEKLDYSILGSEMIGYFRRLVDVLIQNKSSNIKQRVDIMQQMLKYETSESEIKSGTEKKITRNEIVGNSILMIIAGFETTANTLMFLIYCIAMNEDIQKKLQDEINETIEKYGGLTYEAINDMKYLDMCMKESQRLYGVVPRNTRCCEEDITIKGVHIPKGVHVDIPVFAMAHDEEYWDEPWEYKPERFEDMSKIDPMVFQPFGAGPRNCIAKRFAIMEVKMAIAKMLLNFDIHSCDDTPPHPLTLTSSPSVQPKDEIFLKILRKSACVEA